MKSNELEKLKFLFHEHHQQIGRHREKMYDIVKIITGIFLLISGWFATQNYSLSNSSKFALITYLLIIMIAGCWAVSVKNKSFLENARVINKLNTKLKLFTTDDELNESIYPERWKSYGYKGKISGVIGFWFLIIFTGILTMAIIIVNS